MKQVLQALRTGRIDVADVPAPAVRPGHLLVQTARSLISPGTERSIVEFSQAGLIGKARARPEKVRQVLDKIRTDGLLPTLEAVYTRLEEPLPLGYCNAGRVIDVGADVSGFAVGDRVVSNGPHAEIVHVPATLAARMPSGVDEDSAVFAVPGAVALHAVRLTQPTLGEQFAVIGLGLMGLLAVQVLREHGCRVLGVDPDAERCKLAEGFGCRIVPPAEPADVLRAVAAETDDAGVDGVIIAASAKTDEIIHQAAHMCRKRGRIVLLGVVGLELRRSDFYEKELSFQVSCSYGPGRYDPAYEQRGHDYPLPYVRWTAARNFDAILRAVAEGRIDVKPLISGRIPQADAPQAYQSLLDDSSALGVLLTYPEHAPPDRVAVVGAARESDAHTASSDPAARPVVGVIGAGNFATRVLLPAISATGVPIDVIASAGGVSAVRAARKFGARRAATDYNDVLNSSDVKVVFIATRHNTHASIAAEALEAGKHVFVEKPVAIGEEGLDQVLAAWRRNPTLQLMVGMNRRFAPHTVAARRLLAGRTRPIAVCATVNAGALPATHWLNDPEVGGGRIIGEGCHFIDLLMFLVGSPITAVRGAALRGPGDPTRPETTSLLLTFADGSVGTIHYWSNGPRSYPKERVEIFSEGRALVIDNWRRMRGYAWPGARRMWMRQNKGHRAEVAAFLERVRSGGPPLIPASEIALTVQAASAATRAVLEGVTVSLTPPAPERGRVSAPEVTVLT